MLELNQLRCFVAVAEELHFRRAAERLHMTQPPLSRQIQLLEHQLGVELLQRNNRSVKLTAAGRALLNEAYAILRMTENASLQVRRVGAGEAGKIAIGFTAAACYRYLPTAIARWKKTIPDVDLRLKEMVTMSQLEALEAGQLDMALLRPMMRREHLNMRCVQRETLVAALPETHPLAKKQQLVVSDFNHCPFIMYSPDEARYFHELISHLFKTNDIEPRYSQYVTQIHSVLALVHGGLGVALVPQAAQALRNAGIVYRDVADMGDQCRVELYMVWKPENDNPSLNRLIETESAWE